MYREADQRTEDQVSGKPWSGVWLEGSEKVGLNLNIWKSKIMASDPITSWQIDGETMETVTDSVFWGGSKITAEGTVVMKLKSTCSLEEKL